MDALEYQRMIASVAAEMSAPDFFPVNMPENDLHPDPARLQGDILALRHLVRACDTRVTDLEKRVASLEGMPSNVRNFPRR